MLKLIKTTVLDASAASVTISNIPQEFKTLKLIVSARSNDTNAGAFDGLKVQFNSVTTGYSERLLYGTGSSALSTSQSGDNSIHFQYIANNAGTASTFGNTEVTIPNYNSSSNKPVAGSSVSENNGTAAIQALNAGLWSNSAAITSIVLSPNSAGNFLAGSTFYLYGVA